MLAIRLSEEPRTFQVRIGEKLIGRLVVYYSGRVAAEICDARQPTGYRYIEGGHRTLKQATNRLLRYTGFGNCTGVQVERCQGFRTQ